MVDRIHAKAHRRLQQAGVKPTRQRLTLAKLLFEGPHRHVTAETLFRDANQSGDAVSLATAYNTLRQFTEAGLLREVVVDVGQSYFDTNTTPHHHFFDPATLELTDIAADDIQIKTLPRPPAGRHIQGIDVVIRLRRRHHALKTQR